MFDPETWYQLAKLRMAEELRQAERERLVRRAGSPTPSGAIDAVRFRDRLARLFGSTWPTARDGAAPTAA